MIPGNNILNAALSVIASPCFQYYAFSFRSTTANGLYLANYSPPLYLRGSVQAVPRNLYQQYGLDFDKYYQKIFVSRNVIDVDRDVSGDLIHFQGSTFQCLSVTPWFGIDGWVEVLAVRIQNLPLVIAFTAPASGNYATAAHLAFTVNFNMPVTVTGTPHLALSALSGVLGGNAVYTGGSGGTALTFSYTVASGDTARGIAVASPVVGTIASAAGVPANASFPVPNLGGITLNV